MSIALPRRERRGLRERLLVMRHHTGQVQDIDLTVVVEVALMPSAGLVVARQYSVQVCKIDCATQVGVTV